MSSQFIQRLANYLANEVLIKGLANSKTFQRFAVKADASLKDIHKQGEEQLQQVLQQSLKTATADAAAHQGPPQPPLRGVTGFLVAFVKEVRRDITGKV